MPEILANSPDSDKALSGARSPNSTRAKTWEDDPIEREIEAAWETLAIPKIHDLLLAEELVAAGFCSSIEDIFIALTPEQERSLEEKRRQWKEQSDLLNYEVDW